MKPRTLAILALVLALVAGLGWWLHRTLTWRQETIATGYQGEALSNPYLAAQRLLTASGSPCVGLRALPGPGHMPPVQDTLILPRRSQRISPEWAAAMRAWVEAGGHLMAEGLEPEPDASTASRDPLFAAFGARLVEAAGEPSAPTQAPDWPGSFDCTVDKQTLRIWLGNRAWLRDLAGTATAAVGPGEHPHLLQYEVGKGRVWLCSNLAALDNRHLAQQDHADFLVALAQRGPARVWIVVREQPASAWAWLRSHAGPLLLALALFTGAWLWAAAPRFGPLQADPEPGRRGLLEHLEAAGRYQWQHSRGQTLLAAARAAFFRRLDHTHPEWQHLDREALRQRLAQHSGLSLERIDLALHDASVPDAPGFLEAVQTLDHLRKQL